MAIKLSHFDSHSTTWIAQDISKAIQVFKFKFVEALIEY